MKIRIGSIELTDVTKNDMDAVAELVKRFGGEPPKTASRNMTQDYLSNLKEAGASSQPTGAADTVLLRKLVDAGTTGMTTDDIGTILGRRGKAAKKALDEWGVRIGLPTAENADSFEFARVGTRRGWRLKATLLDVAKHLMSQHQ